MQQRGVRVSPLDRRQVYCAMGCASDCRDRSVRAGGRPTLPEEPARRVMRRGNSDTADVAPPHSRTKILSASGQGWLERSHLSGPYCMTKVSHTHVDHVTEVHYALSETELAARVELPRGGNVTHPSKTIPPERGPLETVEAIREF